MDKDAFHRARGTKPAWRVAAEADIPESYLSRIVAGKVNPGIDICRRIADAVGSTLDELWPTSGSQPEPTDPTREGPKKRGNLRSVPKLEATRSAAATLGARGGRARWDGVEPSARSAEMARVARARQSRDGDSSHRFRTGESPSPDLRLIDCVALRRVRSGAVRVAA